jgi:molecular chaperone HscB
MQYILTEEGLLEEGEAYKMDPTFLMEVMELNEMKMDDASPETIRERALTMQEDIYDDVSDLVSGYRGEEEQKESLLKIKDYYYKKKYIDRLLAE